MPTNAYLNLDNNDLKLRDLDSAITNIISSGLSQITADTIVLNGGTQATSGKFRMNTVNQTIEYSADGGLTWTQLDNEALSWNSTTVYSAGDVALYNGALYSCVSSNTNVVPAGAVQWRCIAGGVAYVVVTNTAQLADVLNHAVSDIAIRMQGTFTGTLTATCSAPNVAIYADETTVFGGSAINLTLGSTTNVYWYANGLRLTPGTTLSLNATGGTLWIDRARVTAGTLVLSGNIVYQRIDGNVSVDSNSLATVTQATWTIPGTGQYVEKSLAGLESKAYADELAFYVSGGTAGSGYIHANALLTQIAANAAKYFVINEQGPEADLPESAPEGYIYYTTDTGKLYKYGANGWEEPVQFRGPEGQPGSPGSDGSSGHSPVVSATQTSSGATISVDGVSQAFITNGSNAQTPVLTAEAMTLSAGASATAEIIGTYPNLSIKFGIPQGSNGSNGSNGSAAIPLFTASAISLDPEDEASVSVSGIYPNLAFTFGIPRGSDGTVAQTPIFTATATTLSPDAQATAAVTGTYPNLNIAIGVPRGSTGSAATNPSFTATATTLSAGADATATITGIYPYLTIALGIPRGSDGSGGGGSGGDIAAETPLISSGGTMSILGYPSIGITTVAAASTVVSGGQAYDLSGSAYDEITLTPAVVSGRYAEAWVKVLFGTSAVIASAADMEVVDTLTPEEYNMLHVKMWGTQTRVYVEDHWVGSAPPGPTPTSSVVYSMTLTAGQAYMPNVAGGYMTDGTQAGQNKYTNENGSYYMAYNSTSYKWFMYVASDNRACMSASASNAIRGNWTGEGGILAGGVQLTNTSMTITGSPSGDYYIDGTFVQNVMDMNSFENSVTSAVLTYDSSGTYGSSGWYILVNGSPLYMYSKSATTNDPASLYGVNTFNAPGGGTVQLTIQQA